MLYQQTTQVPNYFFDQLLKTLTEAEIKVFLIILRQTFGWLDKRTGKRKERDRITRGWFVRSTGLSKRAISKAVCSLSLKQLILITDYQGNTLLEGKERKGKVRMYYSVRLPVHYVPSTSAQHAPQLRHETHHNKTNYRKTNRTKLRAGKFEHIGTIIKTAANGNGTN